jgi:hypothetical protein
VAYSVVVDIAGRFMYCSLNYGSLVKRAALNNAAYSVSFLYIGPLKVQQLTVWLW